jgi:hypothetical protein
VRQWTSRDGVTIGAWTAWPKNGTAGIDPYARAMVARTGELPVGVGDGIAFYARTDDAGQPLDGRCDVLLSGITPQARFWTRTGAERMRKTWATRRYRSELVWHRPREYHQRAVTHSG